MMHQSTFLFARRFARHGISLIEVLMSIFIISVGLLGVAALIPLAHYLAERGSTADKAAIAGRNASQEFKARAMENVSTWRDSAGNRITTAPDLVCLDPRGVARGVTTTFPSTGGLTRVTLYNGLDLTATGNKMTLAHADDVFSVQDDLSFYLQNESDPTSLPVQQMEQGTESSAPPVNKWPSAGFDGTNTAHNTPVVVNLLSNDSDPDGDPLTVTSITQPSSGGSVTNNGNGTATFTPTNGFSGPSMFSYTISDGRGGTNSAVARVIVGAPASSGNTATYVNEDNTTKGTWIGVYGNEGYKLCNVTTSGTSGLGSNVSIGAATWTWVDNATDVRALQKPSTSTRIAASWYDLTAYDISVGFSDGQMHRVSLYLIDWDPHNRTQTVAVLNAANTSQVFDTRTVSGYSGGRYLTWDVRGNVIFRLTRTGPVTCVCSGVFISSLPPPPNQAPVAMNDNASTLQNTAVSINLLGNDGDPDADTISLQSFTQPANGNVSGSGSSVTFTPASGFTGSTSFTYTINDGRGGTASATANVTVTAPPAATLKDERRLALRDFTWFATLVREPNSDQHTLSVAVVQGRNGTNSAELTALEEAADVTFIAGSTGIGGGDVVISGGQRVNELKAGDWIMLVKNDRARWYRIVTINEPSGTREATLAGRDWDPAGAYATPKAAIVANTVGVYERTVRLKNDSLWTP